MKIFVISKSGKPLMPTKKPGKVRRMLKEGRARIVGREPFAIQLTYETGEHIGRGGTRRSFATARCGDAGSAIAEWRD